MVGEVDIQQSSTLLHVFEDRIPTSVGKRQTRKWSKVIELRDRAK